jgi:hypothetical protein
MQGGPLNTTNLPEALINLSAVSGRYFPHPSVQEFPPARFANRHVSVLQTLGVFQRKLVVDFLCGPGKLLFQKLCIVAMLFAEHFPKCSKSLSVRLCD